LTQSLSRNTSGDAISFLDLIAGHKEIALGQLRSHDIFMDPSGQLIGEGLSIGHTIHKLKVTLLYIGTQKY